MKKKLALLGIMVIITLTGAGVTCLLDYHEQGMEEDLLRIVTSFYPVYIGTANIVEGIENVELINLTENQGGCLHDYQLTTQDMRKLEHADVVIINGGGMESFARDILKNYPNIQIIDSSVGIPLLEGVSGHEHEEEEEDGHTEESHDEGKNAHIWMNPEAYILQIENIMTELSKIDMINAESYQMNGAAYIEKIQLLNHELDKLPLNGIENGVIIFHDAFAYLADRLSIPVIHCVDMDDEASLSAGEVAYLIEKGRENEVKYIFTEKQFKESAPKRVAEETKATLCVIDSLVSGSMDKDAYLTGMKKNIEVLKQVLADGDGNKHE